ncbi:MAG TPA: NAD-dependent epimerase/dehydratase family protein [Ktedonobacteraceae bacterium]|nr:NAD-dependent epimerase/dehydratase family protein [Ktedonobacteraceae bacterium]
MRCFVTGVAGFVGSHLAERLLADGHEVCGIDSFANDYDRSFKEHNLEGPRSWPMFRFIEGDLMEVVLQPMLEGVDWIFHQAGQEKGQADWGSALTYYTESNVLVTLRLLEAALRFGWVRRFVYASSSSVYGEAARLPIHEDAPERPHSPQGVSKLAAESLCSLYYRRFGLPIVSLRYFSVYGPRQRPDMAFHRFCKAMVCHEPLSLYGDGYQTRDFTYVGDVVEANIRAVMANEVAGQVINIGSGTSVTLRRVVELLEEISGSRINVVVDDSQRDDVRHICADTQRAQQLLGYRPSMDLRDGLTHEFEFIRRLYEQWPNSTATRGVVHQSSNDNGSMAPKESTAARKATTVKLSAVPRPQTSQADSHITESIAKTAQ